MFNNDIGIDLGTANTLVYARGQGIVINEPSVVALDTKKNQVLAVGSDAKDMIGRTPGYVTAVRPMKDGVIADFDVTQNMIKYFIKKSKTFRKPRIVICVPSGVTQVEKRAIIDAAISAGSKEKSTYLIEEPMAASIGAGLPVFSPIGSMIVDIGGGTSEVAVISLGGVVTCESLRIAGDAIDNCIVNYVRKEFNLAIGYRTAEAIKMIVGSVYNPDAYTLLEVRGRDLVSGLPKTIEMSEVDTSHAIMEPVNSIIDSIKATLEKTPPELSSDLMATQITLAGGGALIKGLDALIEKETGMPVAIANEPLNCVANGIGVILDDFEKYKKLLITNKSLKM
ncbi:MAG: rod shape-determining protein [Lachnospirales bacterium]